MRNPIRQNTAHARAVKAILKEIGDYPIIPIVVFADSAELNITTPNHIVINWCNLRSAIKSYRTPCISPEDIQRIVSRISSANITTEGSRESHIRNVQTAQQNRDMAIANGKCPKCGGSLVERRGRYGSFLGCSNYPKCCFTHNRETNNSIIMTKAEMVAEIAVKTGVEKQDVMQVIEGMMETIKASMINGDEVFLRGFGSFIIKHRAEKTARNISKNTTMIIPAHNIPAFRPAKSFVEKLK